MSLEGTTTYNTYVHRIMLVLAVIQADVLVHQSTLCFLASSSVLVLCWTTKLVLVN